MKIFIIFYFFIWGRKIVDKNRGWPLRKRASPFSRGNMAYRVVLERHASLFDTDVKSLEEVYHATCSNTTSWNPLDFPLDKTTKAPMAFQSVSEPLSLLFISLSRCFLFLFISLNIKLSFSTEWRSRYSHPDFSTFFFNLFGKHRHEQLNI